MSSRNCVIYKITNPSGHSYIGKSMDWTGRYNNYKHLLCKEQPALYNSFIKHGFENHTFEILIQNVPEEILSVLEQTWIYLEDSYLKGLNCTKGGEGMLGYVQTEESKKKRSESLKGEKSPWFGKHFSEEHKQNISKGGKGKPKSEETKKKMSAYQKGRKRSEAQKQKLSKANKGKKAHREARLKMSRSRGGRPFKNQHGEIFELVPEAALRLNIGVVGIYNVLNKKRKTTAGYVFTFLDEETK